MKHVGTCRWVILYLCATSLLAAGCTAVPESSAEPEPVGGSSSSSSGGSTDDSAATDDPATSGPTTGSDAATTSDGSSGSSAGGTTTVSSGTTTHEGTASTTSGETDSIPTSSAGCGLPLPEGWLADYELEQGGWAQVAQVDAGGTKRPYIVGLPPGYDPNEVYPVHIVFHALTGTMDHAYGWKVEEHWDEPVIVLAPQGHPYGGGGHQWNWSDPDGPDHAYVQAMLDDVGQRTCIDTARVFASGTSNGAYMTNAVSCVSGVIRGLGASAGGMPLDATTCLEPTTAFLMHGSADTVVPLSQGIAARDKWLSINGCSGASELAVDGRCERYSECSSGAEVYWCVHDGGHPGSSPNALGFSEPMIDLFQAL